MATKPVQQTKKPKVVFPGKVQPGATMAPVVMQVIPGSGGRALIDAAINPTPPPPPSPQTYAPDFFMDALLGGTPRAASVPATQPVTAARVPVPDVYTPNYQSGPSRPETKPLPPPPVRDARKEATARDDAAQLAGIIPLLTLLTGGQGYTAALGNAPGQMARGVAGSAKRSDNLYDEAMGTYGINRANVDAANDESVASWLAELGRAQDANRLESARAQETTRARGDALAANARANVLDQRAQEAERARAQKAAELEQKRVKEVGDTEAERRKERITRVKADEKRLYDLYNSPRASPQTRARVVEELKTLSRQAPELVRRPVVTKDGLLKFTPKEAEQNRVAGENLALRKKADARAAVAAKAKRPAADPEKRVRVSRLNAEVNDLQQMITNPRTSAALRERAIARLQYITTNTGIGPRVRIESGDIANMTPGQRASADRAASKQYNDAAKKVKILSVEEIEE